MQQQFSETLDNRQCRTVIPERKETNKVRDGLPGRPRWASGKETAASAGDTETGVQSLGREDPLEEGTATHSSILAWRVSWTEEPGGYGPWGRKESDTAEYVYTHTHTHTYTSLCGGTLWAIVCKKEKPKHLTKCRSFAEMRAQTSESLEAKTAKT